MIRILLSRFVGLVAVQGALDQHCYFDWYFDRKRESVDVPQATPGKQSTAEKPPARGNTRKRISDAGLFRRRDADDDGRVTLEEFLNGPTGEVVKPLTTRFNSLDRDQDGNWETSEIRRP